MENSIAVISFENQTGDKALDDYREIIPSRLITSLEQSQSFYVMSTERQKDILKQVGKRRPPYHRQRRWASRSAAKRGEGPRHRELYTGPATHSSPTSRSWM